jgi:glutaredoxin
VAKIKLFLDDKKIPYQVLSLEGDPAALTATKRDSKFGVPVVFIAGAAVGRTSELVNLDRSGELERLVWGAKP